VVTDSHLALRSVLQETIAGAFPHPVINIIKNVFSPVRAIQRASIRDGNALVSGMARKTEGVVNMKRTELMVRLDNAIATRSLLKHPFYQEWQAGTLSRERLQLYAAQYYLHVEAFPVHLKVLARRANGALRELILENLAEEENPVAPHPKLWRDFADAVGVSEEVLWTSAPLPGMRVLVETYREICRKKPFAEAVAALYAYEAQVPEIAATKMEGLSRHYGVNTPQGVAYFEVHEEADRVHRAAWRRWLEKCDCSSVGTSEDVDDDRVLATAETALDALWGALDAIRETHC
jgi:pyrroloquinoline-quinone synthase